MKLKIYQIDAFSERVFGGNPAAVCPLAEWLPEELMQKIAMENNLAETAFYVKTAQGFHIRWFTPTVEVDLCGHATLATAHVLFNHEGFAGSEVVFDSRSGYLKVSRHNDLLTLDFPVDTLTALDLTEDLKNAFDISPQKAYKGKTDYMLVFEHEDQIRLLRPHLAHIAQLPVRGVIATASGKSVDFVSRFFGPQSGIDEDPVTGSAHTTLTPYWAAVLQKTELSARQLSAREGELHCTLAHDRVKISGKAQTYLVGEIFV
ncbi:MAG: PhzF family phenazine biosynthesis protein [Microscillaceae bacterium]|jgi:PhzF family phenazine biosynthesis protein|nr:PhzF family phenazine biosynthesis protein [Microscillaceae bacterium]